MRFEVQANERGDLKTRRIFPWCLYDTVDAIVIGIITERETAQGIVGQLNRAEEERSAK